jgi:hypothetical protein
MTANTVTARGRRDSLRWSVMAIPVVLATMIGMLCVAHVASADPAPLTLGDFKGRWVSERSKLTLDIAPCGDGFCGVIVVDNTCGHTALRISERGVGKGVIARPPGYVILEGQLELAAGAKPYGVQASLSRNEAGAERLFIAGHSGGAFSPMRRMYDYRDLMARAGEATCAPAPKTS